MAKHLHFVLILSLFVVLSLAAQDVPTFTIRGFVKDSESHEPLPEVNVFLANTTKGAATSAKGEFVISDVPAGIYDLVVSMVGYERIIQRLRVLEHQKEPLRISLKETTYQFPQIEVVAKDEAEWRKQLSRFKEFLFGGTKNGLKCSLLNPEIVDFKTDPHSDRFEVTARKPLLIENLALGYKLEFVVQVFVIEGPMLKYGGLPHFQELKPKDDEQKLQWDRARERAYRGSLRHFLTALARNRLEQEGFGISVMYQIPNSRTRLVPRESIIRDEIVFPGELPFERRLSFQNYLRVEYTKEAPEPEYSDFWSKQSQYQDPMGDQYQVSWLTLDFGNARISLDGNLYDPYYLKTYGYWSYERIGEWLPLEYLPQNR